MRITNLSALLVFLFITKSVCAQSVNSNSGIEDSLSGMSSLIWKQKTDSARLRTSDAFFKTFQSVLEMRQSEAIPFDSILGITRVASDDGILRIFTWNVPLSDGTNRYFGFIQLLHDNLVLIPLISAANNPADFSTKQFTPQSWYGALYYKLIQVDIGKTKAYTLLGWDGYTPTSNRKIIDIVYIDDEKRIVFGMPVFKTDKGIKSRVSLEYAEKANMLLRYDYQAIRVEKRKKIKKVDTWLIVMDRMVPMDPTMEGFRSYYVPAGDTYDGFVFRNGYWVLVEDIEVVDREKVKK